MAEEPQAALSVIRNKLQVICLRAELSQNPAQCNACAVAISEILKELRSLEVFVLETMRK
ncbi:MAG: hypothetical protein ABSB87_02725 [Terriglobales bacterium]|jgi:hypothetical protein